MIDEGLARAEALGKGRGNVTVGVAARPDWIGGQVGYEHRLPTPIDVSLFGNVVGGMKSGPLGWQPDIGAMGGLKISW